MLRGKKKIDKKVEKQKQAKENKQEEGRARFTPAWEA